MNIWRDCFQECRKKFGKQQFCWHTMISRNFLICSLASTLRSTELTEDYWVAHQLLSAGKAPRKGCSVRRRQRCTRSTVRPSAGQSAQWTQKLQINLVTFAKHEMKICYDYCWISFFHLPPRLHKESTKELWWGGQKISISSSFQYILNLCLSTYVRMGINSKVNNKGYWQQNC